MSRYDERPNHTFVGAQGLDGKEKILLEKVISEMKESELSYESMHTVLVIADNSAYESILNKPQKRS